jgi:flagellar hook-length control protein FliK
LTAGTTIAAPSTAASEKAAGQLPIEVNASIVQVTPAVRLPGEAPATPLGAEVVAALASAALADSAPGASGQSSSDDRQQQSRGKSAEPVSAVAQRLAQTVQLMAGFDRALDVAAPKTAPGETPTLPNEPQVMASIVKSMHLQYQNGVGTAVVKLDPEFLGGVTVSLQLSRGVVTANLQADRADVRAWLEANQHTLREALGQHGLTLDRLVVSEERPAQRDATPDGRRKPPQKQAPRGSRKAPSNESVTFEVVV